MSTISYHLPMSTLIVTGTRRRTTDALAASLNAPPVTETLQDVVVSLEVTADDEALDVEIKGGGRLATHKGAVGLTTDRRLVSVDWTSTGALPKIVSAVSSLVGTVLGAIVLGADDDALRRALGAATTAEARAYAEAHADVSTRATALSERRAQLIVALDTLLDTVAAGTTPGHRARQAELEAALRRTEADQVLVRAAYAAWREAQRTTVEEPMTLRLAIADLPSDDPLIGVTGLEPVTDATTIVGVSDLARRYGLGLHRTWPGKSSRDSATPYPAHDEREVVVRVPDLMELVVTRLEPGPPARIAEVSRTRHLVVDERSRTERYPLDRSFWGDRSVVLDFDDDGLLTGLTTGGSSSLVAGLDAVAGIPGQVSAGIDAAVGVSTSLATARRTALANQTARLKAQIDQRTQAAAEAGLDLTERDALQLLALQQRKTLLEMRQAVVGLDPTAVLPDLDPVLLPGGGGGSGAEHVLRIVVVPDGASDGARSSTTPAASPAPALGG